MGRNGASLPHAYTSDNFTLRFGSLHCVAKGGQALDNTVPILAVVKCLFLGI
uniref:Uncharacterized protein n=1 Tax=uncultured marine virus TaxID=186617 RepID=A0A0F7L593_9VIRU|nr:hypothetical protein [uncultured marine virus]